MASTESLRRSIAITRELHSMVKTMKALAGVNIRQCERTVHAVEEYNQTVEMGLQVAIERLGPQAAPPKGVAEKKLGALVFGSDQGMCGLLNDQVVSHATRALQKFASHRESQLILPVGIRAASQLESLGHKIEDSVRVPSSVFGINAAVEEVLRVIEDWHTKRGIELVVLFYARPATGAWYRVVGVRLLPVDEEWINGLRARRWPSRVIPMFTMEEGELFRLLIHEYLFVSLFRAFADSLASENASRLASMQVAERNIEDRLRALTMESRRLRQDSITEELLDIIASFEALGGKELAGARRG